MSLLDSASLICTPNGYKEGKLYSVIPSDGSGDLSVTRATTATRVNSAGLVELVPYNLVQYSEQLNDSSWNKLNVTITPNSTTAPDGTLTADTMTNSSTGYGLWQTVSVAPSTQYTFSFYVKKGTNTSYIISVIDAVSFADIATLDYSSQVGTDWVRVSTTFTTLSTTSFIRVYQMRDGSSTGTAFLWGAQLVEGSVAKDYQKTETRLNIPRLDYSNGTCPSILVEPQRTNISQYIESGSAGFNAATITNATSIVGLKTFKVTNNISGFGDAPYIFSNIEYQANTTYTFSFYTDFNECTSATISCSFLGFFPSVSYTGIIVDKTTKAITTFNVGGVFTLNSYEAIQVSGEIYKIVATATPNASGSSSRNYISSDANTSAMVVAGVQLEAGSYATSYIQKTTGASVTRNADVISKTGISSLIGQTEGTLFIDTYIDNISAQTNNPVLIYAKGASGEDLYIEISNSGHVIGVFYNGSSVECFIYVNIGLTNGRHKFAFGYKNNDFVLYVDGVQVGTDTSGTMSGSLTEFGLQYYDNFYRGAQEINSAALWKTRLTNAQLATLTTI